MCVCVSYLRNLCLRTCCHWTRWLTPVIQHTWEAENRRMKVQSQSGQKFSENTSQWVSQVWWYISIILVIPEAVCRRIKTSGWPQAKTWDSIRKITTARPGVVAHTCNTSYLMLEISLRYWDVRRQRTQLRSQQARQNLLLQKGGP
jgi:hypothetical protein